MKPVPTLHHAYPRYGVLSSDSWRHGRPYPLPTVHKTGGRGTASVESGGRRPRKGEKRGEVRGGRGSSLGRVRGPRTPSSRVGSVRGTSGGEGERRGSSILRRPGYHPERQALHQGTPLSPVPE